jgi:tRNA(fMet)-specific endonuclease VapC
VRYLLDTNIISAMVRDPRGVIAKRIHDVGEATVSTSIVAATLRYGAAKKGSARLSAQLDLCSTRWTCCPSRYPLMGVEANCARS